MVFAVRSADDVDGEYTLEQRYGHTSIELREEAIKMRTSNSALKLLTPVALLSLLVGCSPMQPIDRGAESIVSYANAKRELAERLGEAIGATKSSNYRLVALVGPSYPIGAAVDVDNPANLLTENCIIPKSQLPAEPTPWTEFPRSKTKRRIDLSADVPSPVKKALNDVVDAGIKVDWQQAGDFGLSDLSQVLIAQDRFEQAIAAPMCQKSLGKRAVLLVRGVVSGKEVFSSTRQLGVGADVKAWQSDLFKVRYDGSGAYELEDAKVKPKFYVVTLVLPKERGEPLKLERPADKVVQIVERALQLIPALTP